MLVSELLQILYHSVPQTLCNTCIKESTTAAFTALSGLNARAPRALSSTEVVVQKTFCSSASVCRSRFRFEAM